MADTPESMEARAEELERAEGWLAWEGGSSPIELDRIDAMRSEAATLRARAAEMRGREDDAR